MNKKTIAYFYCFSELENIYRRFVGFDMSYDEVYVEKVRKMKIDISLTINLKTKVKGRFF